MRSIDYNYIGTMIGNLFGVPIHIYKNNSLIFYHSTVNLIKDPISIYESDILKITEQINYFLTTRFNYFGILNSKDYKIVSAQQVRFLILFRYFGNWLFN